MSRFQPTRVDREATAAMKFRNRRSYVHLDSTHWLFGADRTAIREEVFADANGACYFGLPGCHGVTNFARGQMHHLRPLGKGGDWSRANLVWACRACHGSQHVQVRLKWLN